MERVNSPDRPERPTFGFLDPQYVGSLRDLGRPRALPRAGSWVIEREIAGTGWYDGMGVYPIMRCADWNALATDLGETCGDLVAVSAVTDPLGDYDTDTLQLAFPDLCRPFKKHYIIDLRRDWRTHLARQHRQNIAKALRSLVFPEPGPPLDHFEEWASLYAGLADRKSFGGVARYDREAHLAQLGIRGAVGFRAYLNDELVGMSVWYPDERDTYCHFAAASPVGYGNSAMFGLHWSALQYFETQGLSAVSIGSGRGIVEDDNDGLSRFKRGWATRTATAYLVGRIFDRDRYEELRRRTGIEGDDYFPIYRKGEFS